MDPDSVLNTYQINCLWVQENALRVQQVRIVASWANLICSPPQAFLSKADLTTRWTASSSSVPSSSSKHHLGRTGHLRSGQPSRKSLGVTTELGQLLGGKNPQVACPHPPICPCLWPSRGVTGIPRTQCRPHGEPRRHLSLRIRQAAKPGMPGVSLPPAHPARKSSAMARPREPPESYYSYGPRAVGAPTVRQAWSGWRLGDDS